MVVPFGSDPLDRLRIPDGTTVEEHDLVTDGDVLIGGQSDVEFGIRGRSIVAGERVSVGGGLEAENDVRLDLWSSVDGDVLVGEDAYIGERVHVGGHLKVAGDLDIGDDVDIEEGFEANGWIVIRNPMPTIVFLFVYLSHLLRMGEEDAAEDVLSEFVDGERDREPLVIPGSARVSDDVWRVSTPATVGDDCRVHGNLRARTLEVGRDNIVFGSLRARSDVTVGRGTEIKGDVSTRDGDVRIGPGATVWGDVAAADVELHENATVEGTIRARGEMRLHTDAVIQRPDETAAAMAEMARELGDGPDGEGNEPGACDTADSLRDDDGAADGEGDAEADRDTADAAERDTADASDADEPASPEASD